MLPCDNAAEAAVIVNEAIRDDASSATTEVESVDKPPVEAVSASENLPAAVQSKHRSTVLILFSGRQDVSGNLESCLTKLGLHVESFDIINGSGFDLSDDAIWEPLHKRIVSGEFAAVVASPPCGTFSRLRSIPGGPPPLHGILGRDRYGLVGLDKRQAEHKFASAIYLRFVVYMQWYRCTGAVEPPSSNNLHSRMVRCQC